MKEQHHRQILITGCESMYPVVLSKVVVNRMFDYYLVFQVNGEDASSFFEAKMPSSKSAIEAGEIISSDNAKIEKSSS